jgi:hypothetical protein
MRCGNGILDLKPTVNEGEHGYAVDYPYLGCPSKKLDRSRVRQIIRLIDGSIYISSKSWINGR